MKLFRKVMAGASAVAMMSICCYSTVQEVSNIETIDAVVDDCNDDWLHADGSHLYDKDGNEVWITGANWFGFNCGENILHGLWSADIDELLSSIADHGINCLRMPISTELLLSWMNGTPNECSSVSAGNDAPYYVINPDFLNDDGSLKNSMELFDIIMGKCKQYGIKVLVDIHSPDANNSGHNYNLWYGKETSDGTMVTTEVWQETLVWLADKYSNDDTIIGYDLKNEPHGKGQEGSTAAKWDGSTDENNWAYAATNCALAIMEVNPNALIFVEGVEQYPKTGKTWGQPDSLTDPPYYPAWWGGQFRGVRDYPIDLGEYQSQLVYSPHDYGPGVYAQTWFDKDFTTQTLLDDYWYDTWAFINAEDIAPLLIGEWGGFMDDGDNEKWLTLLRDYMIDNHINHTFWCINPNSGDTGGLLDSTFSNWDEDKYALLEPALWQDDDGVYIGLDHQTALGANGQSLSDFYASGKGSNLDASGESNPKDLIDAVTDTTTAVTTTVSETENTTINPEENITYAGTVEDITDTEISIKTIIGDVWTAPLEIAPSDISVGDSVTISTSYGNVDSISIVEETTTTTSTTDTSEVSTPSEVATDTSSSTVSSSSSSDNSKETTLGDVDCNGEITSVDLLILKKYLLGMDVEISEQGLINANVNSDDEINSVDLVMLKKFVLNMIDEF